MKLFEDPKNSMGLCRILPLACIAIFGILLLALTKGKNEPVILYFETLTNKDGDFKIPGKGLNIIRNMPPPIIAIFKTGYSILHLQDLGINFRRDNPLNNEVQWSNPKFDPNSHPAPNSNPEGYL